MEKVLDYSRDRIKQDTYYWCGPATVQTLIQSRTRRFLEESALAQELKTHVGGTDHIWLFPPVLNRHMAGADYAAVEMPNDPPTRAQCDRFWNDLKRSIDAGYGVVVNIVAPVSNYPRGVNGSISPTYGGGTVYHYFAAMGYKDDGARAVWIADSGFWPYGYWIGFDQLCTLAPPKGYVFARGGAVAPAPAPVAPARRTSFGVDISNWQKGINVAQIKREGFDFAICKVSEGAGYLDPQWRGFRDQAVAAGLHVGGYIFVNPWDSAQSQVDAYLRNDGAKNVCVLDVEDHRATVSMSLVRDIRDRLKAAGVRKVGFYTYRPYHQKMGSPSLTDFDFVWVAAYGNNPSGYASVIYPGDRADGWAPMGGVIPLMWQFGSKGSVAGMSIDVNAVRDGVDAVAELFGGEDGFLMALTDAQQKELYDRVCGRMKSLVPGSEFQTHMPEYVRINDARLFAVEERLTKLDAKMDRLLDALSR